MLYFSNYQEKHKNPTIFVIMYRCKYALLFHILMSFQTNKQTNKRTNEQTTKLITIISIAGIDHQKK